MFIGFSRNGVYTLTFHLLNLIENVWEKLGMLLSNNVPYHYLYGGSEWDED